MKVITILLALTFSLLLCACNLAKDTADTTEKGGEGAVGLAEKMSGGTVGETDMESGETSGGSENSDTASGE